MYSYAGARARFAEKNISEDKLGQVDEDVNDEDEISSQLAWSRVLGCLRRSFSVGSHWAVVDIETVWEEYWDQVWGELENRKEQEDHERVSDSAIDILARHGHYGELGCPAGKSRVNCVPTMAGGEFSFWLAALSLLLCARADASRLDHLILERVLRSYVHS